MHSQPPLPSTNPLLADSLYKNALSLIDKGKKEEAEKLLRQVISTQPSVDAYYTLGTLLAEDMDKSQEALHAFEDAVLLDGKHHQSYAAMAELFWKNLHFFEAIECYGIATDLCPDNYEYQERLLEQIRHFKLKKHNPALKEKVLKCLQTPELDCMRIGMTWHNLLKLDAAFKPIYKAVHQQTYPYFKKVFLKAKDFTPLTDPFFIEGLKHTMVYDLDMESFITGLRHILLDNLESGELDIPTDDLVKLTAALSCYCFETEYIYEESDEERQKIEAIKAEIESGKRKADDLYALAILACYHALYGLKNSDSLEKSMSGHPDMQDVAEKQIRELKTINAIKDKIEQFTPIDDTVSKKVQEQYEEFPYPRWASYSKLIYDEKIEGYLRDKKADILVAGCGTGREAIELATVFPDAQITAIDLSSTSLAYGIMKAERLGIKNITFGQGDILRLGESDKIKTYDYIASSGVLHHMQDPVAGWKVLESLLKPGAAMRIALYSDLARRGIAKGHELIKEKGYEDDAEGIRTFRREAPRLLKKHDFDLIKKYRDYFYMSGCRDLLFHVQEHRFNLLQVKDILKDLKLKFAGFHQPLATFIIYEKEFPDDKDVLNLDNWHKFEEKHPDIFSDMYLFWCRKD